MYVSFSYHDDYHYLKECEREILRLKTLLDEHRRERHVNEVTRSLADELEQVCEKLKPTNRNGSLSIYFIIVQMSQSLTTARIHLETRLSQEQALEREVDSLIQWLNQFIEERSSMTDHQVR